jgi:hypothetical protein
MLLVLFGSGSMTAGAQAVTPATLLAPRIERDLAAIEAQLEAVRADPIATASRPGDGEGVAYTLDLADAGVQFRLRKLATIVRSLVRRIDARAGDSVPAGTGAQDQQRLLHLRVHSLLWAVEELRFASTPADVERALARVDEQFTSLRIRLPDLLLAHGR